MLRGRISAPVSHEKDPAGPFPVCVVFHHLVHSPAAKSRGIGQATNTIGQEGISAGRARSATPSELLPNPLLAPMSRLPTCGVGPA